MSESISSSALYATDTAGKYPHLLFSPNTEAPSARVVASNRYLSRYEYLTRPIKDKDRLRETNRLLLNNSDASPL